MRAIFCAVHEIHLRVPHDCKKHASNTLCAARETVFLCAAHKLTAIVYQRKSRHTMKWHISKRDKTHGNEENSILSSIYILLFQSTLDDIVSNQLNAKHDNGKKFRQHEH